ncbi:FCS-Like Zinc finger 10-like [Cornus florida]|uniref:FCS-Like Zinc finger 10-like n=1 Tax=Cornus florida TaxID=4283 RepID=UPI0028994246|nr:FCS-Like Zinc finger 10-like [Cornus florida]
MLRKRTRSQQKDQHMGHLVSDAISESYVQSDALEQKHKTNSFFNAPSLFVGLLPKGSEFDSARSPTSPLDFRVFTNLGSPFRSPRSVHEGHQKSWDCSKVGLSIIDSLNDDKQQLGKVLRSSDSKNILFGPQMSVKTPNFRNRIDSFEAPKSLPKNYAIFPFTQIKHSNLQMGNSDVLFKLGEIPFGTEPFGAIRSCSLDSGRTGSHLASLTNHSTNSSSGYFHSENGKNPVSSPPQSIGGSKNLGNSSGTGLNSIPKSITSSGFIGPLSASEIELSEDYTCVRTHGPNPKTIHIFGDCILECDNYDLAKFSKKEENEIDMSPAMAVEPSEIPVPHPCNDFLSFCYTCKKKLDGEDIYMYRGEKAFCSWSCRAEEILIEEAMEKNINNVSPKNSPISNDCEELFGSGMFIAA